MGYRNLQECVGDLERRGMLLRISTPLDPRLEIGAVQRRVYRAGGPALLFTNPVNCSFPLLGNLFGTLERTRFIFRDSLDDIRCLVDAKINPFSLVKHPLDALKAPFAACRLLPKTVSQAPVLECRTTLSRLPQVISWPNDGGAFVTLPQVYIESPAKPGFGALQPGDVPGAAIRQQLWPDKQAGLHYQIQRGIGVHHAEAIATGRPAAGERLCGRRPLHDRGGGHAAAGRDAGTLLCRTSGRPHDPHGQPRRDSCRSRPRPISASAVWSIPEKPCRKALSATISATTAWPTIFPLSRWRRSTTAVTPSGPLPRSGAPPRRTPASAPLSMN